MCIIPHHLGSAPHPQLFSQIAPSIFSGIICPSDIPHCLFSPIFHQSDKKCYSSSSSGSEDERYVASSKGEITRHHFVVSYSLATLQVYCPAFSHPLMVTIIVVIFAPPENSSSSSSSSLQRFSRFVGSYAVTSPHVYWWSLSYLSNRKHSIIHQTAIPSRFTTATFDCSPTFSQTLSHIFNVIHPMDHFSFLLILLSYFFFSSCLNQSFLVAVTLFCVFFFLSVELNFTRESIENPSKTSSLFSNAHQISLKYMPFLVFSFYVQSPLLIIDWLLDDIQKPVNSQ